MEWQTTLALASIVFAAMFVARAMWRTWTPRDGQCGGGCGCDRQSNTQTKSSTTKTRHPLSIQKQAN